MRTLISVNLEHKRYGLKRQTMRPGMESVVYNFRKLIHDLGYDCSLLRDDEILAFEEDIHLYERSPDDSLLVEILDFLTDKPVKKTTSFEVLNVNDHFTNTGGVVFKKISDSEAIKLFERINDDLILAQGVRPARFMPYCTVIPCTITIK